MLSSPLDEEKNKCSQHGGGNEASMMESMSMFGSRGTTRVQREDGELPSPATEMIERSVEERGVDPAQHEKKPWLRCGIGRWEQFLFEPTHAHLLASAELKHDKDEWLNLYDRCVIGNHLDDVKGLLRLICAQTRVMNDGSSELLFPRVGNAVGYVKGLSEVTAELDDWKNNRESLGIGQKHVRMQRKSYDVNYQKV